MTYFELSMIMNQDHWFAEVQHGENEDKLSSLVKNYNSAYIEGDVINKNYIKEIATIKDTYLLCIIPTIAQIKKSSGIEDFATDIALSIQKKLIKNIRAWAEQYGIPIHKVHFTEITNFTDFCYSRDILICTDKNIADIWSEAGGVGIADN